MEVYGNREIYFIPPVPSFKMTIEDNLSSGAKTHPSQPGSSPLTPRFKLQLHNSSSGLRFGRENLLLRQLPPASPYRHLAMTVGQGKLADLNG